MSGFLYRLGRSSARHPFRVIGLWLVAAFVVMSLQGSVGGEYADNFTVPGVESQDAVDILEDRFPSQSNAGSRLVLHTEDGRLDDAAHRATVDQAIATLAAGSDVAEVSDPFAPGSQAISADGRTAYIDLDYAIDDITVEHFDEAEVAADAARAQGIELEYSGALAWVADQAAGNEALGLMVAAVVLLFAFGSVIAMGLPIGTAIFGIMLGTAGVGILAGFTDVPGLAKVVTMMIGLGVGIDYALFIVTRHRQELHSGKSVADAAGTAIATAGSAVLFAGTTVVIAILGLFIAGLPAVTMLGVSVAIVVVVAMLAAVSLLPGLLGLAGTKIDKLSIHRKSHVEKPAEQTVSGRWAHRVGNRPGRYALISLAALVVLSIPALAMRIGMPDDGNNADERTERKAYDQLAEGFGPGFNGPIVAVVDLASADDQATVGRVADALRTTPGIAAVAAPQLNAAGDTATIVANPTTSPQDEATDELVRHLRSDVLPASVEGTGAEVLLTGQAMTTDMTDRITQRLPWFIGAVVLVSFLLLVVVFRSILVPLKAALMNLLSIGASYGVVVAMFQWGWGKDLIGLDQTVPINPFAPLLMFAVLFGLSMDYEVFLLSRVREEYLKTGDSHSSVVTGLSSTARVITSAALIMISVFGAVALDVDPTAKMFGIGLSVAVFLDATLVRMVLVPATMSLLGSANWWLPTWLDRILPHLDLEAEPADAEVVDLTTERPAHRERIAA